MYIGPNHVFVYLYVWIFREKKLPWKYQYNEEAKKITKLWNKLKKWIETPEFVGPFEFY